MMEGELIGPENRRWKNWLATTLHDFYHLPEYVALCAAQEQAEACAFLATQGSHRLLLPLILRPLTIAGTTIPGHYDATSPYGYPSPLLWRLESPHGGHLDDEDFLKHALHFLRWELQTRNVVALFVRFHPMLPVPLEPFRQQGTLVYHGETVFCDLTLPEEEQWRQMRATYHNRINRARRNGLVAEIDPQWASFDDFLEIYTETMHRVGADPFYFFSRQYLLDLRNALDGRLHLATVRIGSELACAGLFSEVGGIVQLHLTGSREEYAAHHVSKFMIDFIRRWARERGNHVLHLGGGLGSQDDSLLYYKAGFSHLRGQFHTWRSVIQADHYQVLVRRWEQQASAPAAGPEDFFPAYRQPFPTAVEKATLANTPQKRAIEASPEALPDGSTAS